MTEYNAWLRRAVAPIAMALLMIAASVTAFAQDPDEKPVPMDTATKSLQLWVFGGIAAVVILGGVWYGFRIMQIRRSGKTTDAQAHWHD
jgi:hypothetical protein